MSHTQVHHFFIWTHLQMSMNTIHIFFSKYEHQILWHMGSLMKWCMECLWPSILLSRWLQIWLIYRMHCMMLMIIVILLLCTIKHLIKIIIIWSISFHLPLSQIYKLISYQFAIFLINTWNHVCLSAASFLFVKKRLSQQAIWLSA